MSSGGTCAVPSVHEPHSLFGPFSMTLRLFCRSLLARNTIPRSSALSTAERTVALCCSWMKNVLTDSPNPDHMLWTPVMFSPAFLGQYLPPQLASLTLR